MERDTGDKMQISCTQVHGALCIQASI